MDVVPSDLNRWKIPQALEVEIAARNQHCVYCRIGFESPAPTRGSMATWEHIINDATIVTLENIAMCCASCNSSKGTKRLSDWIESDYCRKRGISRDTVAEVVKKALS